MFGGGPVLLCLFSNKKAVFLDMVHPTPSVLSPKPCYAKPLSLCQARLLDKGCVLRHGDCGWEGDRCGERGVSRSLLLISSVSFIYARNCFASQRRYAEDVRAPGGQPRSAARVLIQWRNSPFAVRPCCVSYQCRGTRVGASVLSQRHRHVI